MTGGHHANQLLTKVSFLNFRQHMFEIFRKTNPAGDITTRDLYFRSLTACIAVGVLVTLKRVQLGFHLGRRIFGKQ